MRRVLSAFVVALVVGLWSMPGVFAQGRQGGAPQGLPPTPQAAAPIDVTGYWVAIVNEDWRWRMVTPAKGDLASVPLNPEGTKVANSWNPATDGSCLAYGAAALMRMPTRLHITWENDRTIKVDTDAGQQTRRLVFDKSQPPPAQRSLQGFSIADWELAGAGGRGAAPAPRTGNLKVSTSMMSGGWLRKNGAPYSENATLTEYFDRFAAPNGDEWLVVTTIVSDPKYLNTDFVTSSHFKKEPNGSKWAPSPCKS
jgi:hypothetical protein